MKARGIFKLFTALALFARDLVRTHSTENYSSRVSNGRDAFFGVSAPRCHTQKKIYRGFTARSRA